MNNVGKKEKL